MHLVKPLSTCYFLPAPCGIGEGDSSHKFIPEFWSGQHHPWKNSTLRTKYANECGYNDRGGSELTWNRDSIKILSNSSLYLPLCGKATLETPKHHVSTRTDKPCKVETDARTMAEIASPASTLPVANPIPMLNATIMTISKNRILKWSSTIFTTRTFRPTSCLLTSPAKPI